MLPTLYGASEAVLARARAQLPSYVAVQTALADLQTATEHLQPHVASIGIDLADLRGYHYHSGMVFSAYHEGSHDAIALGGRYDDLGKSFGRARAATGFSLDLRQLYRLLPAQAVQTGIRAPHAQDAGLLAKIAALRAAGEVVVVDLLGDAQCRDELQCDRQLSFSNGEWRLVAL